MTNNDERIREMAKSLRETNQAQNSEILIHEADNRLQLIRESENERRNSLNVTVLCGRFAIWAEVNSIPFNSPSPFARGWIVGERESEPSSSGSHQGESWESKSIASLLVKPSGRLGELIIKNVHKTRPNNLFSKKAEPEKYDLGSVISSIAKFSFENKIDWQE